MHDASSTLTGELDRQAFLCGMSAFGGALMLPTEAKPEKTIITKTTHGQLRDYREERLL